MYLRSFTLPQTLQAAAAVLKDVLFLPNNKVFESVDAVCPSRGYVIQNTVADRHDLKFPGLREVFKVFPADMQVSKCQLHCLFHLFTSHVVTLGSLSEKVCFGVCKAVHLSSAIRPCHELFPLFDST